jgi:thiol-disulfide isomerase/thioredoxin
MASFAFPQMSSKNIMIGVAVVGFLIFVAYFAGFSPLRGNGPSSQGFANMDNTFTMYYVDWCPHCQTAKPIFQEWMGNGSVNVKGTAVHCKMVNPEKEPEAAKGVNVKGYPSFMLSKNGQLIEFNGPRTADGFQAFLEQNM